MPWHVVDIVLDMAEKNLFAAVDLLLDSLHDLKSLEKLRV